MEFLVSNSDSITAILQLIGAALGSFATAWIARKWKSEKVKEILGKFYALVEEIVREVYQVYVADLKLANADGRLTPAEKEHAKKMAMDKLKSYLGWWGLKKILWVLGVKSEFLDDLLSTKIESTINAVKKASKGSEVSALVPLPK